MNSIRSNGILPLEPVGIQTLNNITQFLFLSIHRRKLAANEELRKKEESLFSKVLRSVILKQNKKKTVAFGDV